MYSQLIETIITIGMLRIAITAVGWVAAIGSIILWIRIGYGTSTYQNYKKLFPVSSSIFLTLLCIFCISVYNIPHLKEEVVVARQVAIVLDDYAERNPESVYNPDIALTALDSTIKGIVNTAVNLPEYINRLASGLEVMTRPIAERPIEELSRAELEQRLRDAERRR